MSKIVVPLTLKLNKEDESCFFILFNRKITKKPYQNLFIPFKSSLYGLSNELIPIFLTHVIKTPTPLMLFQFFSNAPLLLVEIL